MEKVLRLLQSNKWIIFLFSIVDIYLLISISVSDFNWFRVLPKTLYFGSLGFGLFISIVILYYIYKLGIDGLLIYFFSSQSSVFDDDPFQGEGLDCSGDLDI
jgi:hypothetical protein